MKVQGDNKLYNYHNISIISYIQLWENTTG